MLFVLFLLQVLAVGMVYVVWIKILYNNKQGKRKHTHIILQERERETDRQTLNMHTHTHLWGESEWKS